MCALYGSKQPRRARSSLPSVCATMALREAWLSAQESRLCAWQQARALALREASAKIHSAPWLPWIAERVAKAPSRCGASLNLARHSHTALHANLA